MWWWTLSGSMFWKTHIIPNDRTVPLIFSYWKDGLISRWQSYQLRQWIIALHLLLNGTHNELIYRRKIVLWTGKCNRKHINSSDKFIVGNKKHCWIMWIHCIEYEKRVFAMFVWFNLLCLIEYSLFSEFVCFSLLVSMK